MSSPTEATQQTDDAFSDPIRLAFAAHLIRIGLARQGLTL